MVHRGDQQGLGGWPAHRVDAEQERVVDDVRRPAGGVVEGEHV